MRTPHKNTDKNQITFNISPGPRWKAAQSKMKDSTGRSDALRTGEGAVVAHAGDIGSPGHKDTLVVL